MRAVVGVLCATTCVSSVLAQPAAAPDYAKAYDYAVRCMAVVGIAGDKAGSRRAFDAAVRLGRLQQLSNAEINVALDFAVIRETSLIKRDRNYMTKTVALCRQLGFAN